MINWRHIPMIRVAAVVILGIVLANKFCSYPIYVVSSWIIFIVSLIGVLYSNYKKSISSNVTGICLLLFLFGFALLRTYYQDTRFNPHHYNNHITHIDRVVGIVQEIPKVRNSTKTEIEVTTVIDSSGKATKVVGKMLLYFKGNDTKASRYLPGDEVLVQGKIQTIRPSGNPHSFDFKSYLKYRGIEYQIFVSDSLHHLKLSAGKLPILTQYAMDMRNHIMKVYRKYIISDDHLAISAAMILGFRNNVSDELYQAFSDSGSVHILAVSGLHVGIVAMFFMFFFDLIKTKNKYYHWIKTGVIIIFIWFFTLLTGSAPAMVRAAIMFTLLLLGRMFKKETNVFNILAFCATVMLVYDPYLLFQASFQFSFMALLSIAFFNPYVQHLFVSRNIVLSKAWEYAAAAFTAQILVFPITVYFFHKVPVYFMLSGIFSVFLSIIALYLGIVVCIFEAIWPLLNQVFAPLFVLFIDLFVQSVVEIKKLPYSSIDGLYISAYETVAIYGALLFFMLFLAKKQAVHLQYVLVSLVIFALMYGFRKNGQINQLDFYVYDVNNDTMIDFVDGTTVFAFNAKALDDDDIGFVAKNNRFYHGVKKVYPFDRHQNFEYLRVKKQDDVLWVKDKMVYLVDSVYQVSKAEKADFIVVCKGNKKVPESLEIHKPTTLICDKSIRKKYAESWRQLCLDNQMLTFYSISEKGAFHLKIN